MRAASTGPFSCQASIERENRRWLVNSGEFVVDGERHEGRMQEIGRHAYASTEMTLRLRGALRQ
jgi:hypothetical protein